MGEERYILSIDAGSTGLRVALMNRSGRFIASEYEQTPASHPEEGATEHNPVLLWEVLQGVLKKLMAASGIPPSKIAGIGITNQRSSFCFWDKETGIPLTPFINWQDVRAAEVAEAMNRSLFFKVLKVAAGAIGRVTRMTMMVATSLLKFNTDHTITKVRWLLDRDPVLEKRCRDGLALFGTLDTWFIYKLTGGIEHLTDVTNASSTAMFNPFDLIWNPIFCKLFRIPMNIFPEVRDTAGDFGWTVPGILGESIPIGCAVGDQQSSLFGHTCFDSGEVKISLGSGAFVNINVGKKGRVSRRGLFPLICWRVSGEICYMLEGQLATLGTMIDWACGKMGWFRDPQELNRLAAACEDSGGIWILPTLSGIRFPYFQPRLRGGVIGLDLSSRPEQLARALINGFAHRLTDILEGVEKDTGVRVTSIKVDGGVSQSGILLQTLADLTGCRVYRASEPEVTARGAAYLAGLSTGFWEDSASLKNLDIEYFPFIPVKTGQWREMERLKWRKTVKKQLE